MLLREYSAVVYCLAVFLGASLMFVLEPLAGKLVVPQFGGTAGVWSVCLLFFQLVVLIGYSCTWFLARRPLKFQVPIYCLAGVAPVVLCSTIPGAENWVCTDFANPAWPLLLCLIKYLLLPAVFVATISGMMQVWFSKVCQRDPYPLYSLSNAGSLLSLLAYPLLLEPHFTVNETIAGWQIGYLVLVALVVLGGAGLLLVRSPSAAADQAKAAVPEVPEDTAGGASLISLWLTRSGSTAAWQRFGWWTALSATGSLVLLSYTSHVTADVAPVPLLWVMPLAVYLLTFVIAFGKQSFYFPRFYLFVWLPIAVAERYAYPLLGYKWAVAVNLALVFCLCMLCHGELAASKPSARQLPTFYLALACGGFLGGVFATFLAPQFFNFEAERIIVLLLATIICIFAARWRQIYKYQEAVLSAFLLFFIGLVAGFWFDYNIEGVICRQRNFYSSVCVWQTGQKRLFVHGRINHGEENMERPRETSGAYWPPMNLIDHFVRAGKPARSPVAYGSIGLGVGVLAVYGKSGDTIRFFELDPKVKDIAERFFTFLSASPANYQIDVGDGRALLAHRQSDRGFNFDLLLIDAFNGDAIPCHLLTKQAIEIYKKQINKDGLIVFHVTNRYVNLAPVLAATAEQTGLFASALEGAGRVKYVVLVRDKARLADLEKFSHTNPIAGCNLVSIDTGRTRAWTDDFIDLVSALK